MMVGVGGGGVHDNRSGKWWGVGGDTNRRRREKEGHIDMGGEGPEEGRR